MRVMTLARIVEREMTRGDLKGRTKARGLEGKSFSSIGSYPLSKGSPSYPTLFGLSLGVPFVQCVYRLKGSTHTMTYKGIRGGATPCTRTKKRENQRASSGGQNPGDCTKGLYFHCDQTYHLMHQYGKESLCLILLTEEDVIGKTEEEAIQESEEGVA